MSDVQDLQPSDVPAAAPSPAQAAIDEHAALPGTPDPNWPEPDSDGHVWEHVEVTCESCGAANKLHRQKPEWLALPQGVKWECTSCGAANKLGGYDPLPAADFVLECVACHNTYDPNAIEQAADGTWTCPADGCKQTQRHVAHGDAGESSQTGVVA